MSELSSDVIEGFQELLDAAGVDLICEGLEVRALIKTETPATEKYDLTPGDDQSVQVSAFVSVFVNGVPAIGDYFTDENNTRYRVKSGRLRPGQPIIRFSCEVSES